jgi:hypothetical protein
VSGFGRADTSFRLRPLSASGLSAFSQGWQKPGLKKKNTSPVVFFGFYWVFGVFWVFLNFRLITDIFLPLFGRYNFFISKKYLILST